MSTVKKSSRQPNLTSCDLQKVVGLARWTQLAIGNKRHE
jgi:hypothetical protein